MIIYYFHYLLLPLLLYSTNLLLGMDGACLQLLLCCMVKLSFKLREGLLYESIEVKVVSGFGEFGDDDKTQLLQFLNYSYWWDGRVIDVLLELVNDQLDYPRKLLVLKFMNLMERIYIFIHYFVNQVVVEDGEMTCISHTMISILCSM